MRYTHSIIYMRFERSPKSCISFIISPHLSWYSRPVLLNHGDVSQYQNLEQYSNKKYLKFKHFIFILKRQKNYYHDICPQMKYSVKKTSNIISEKVENHCRRLSRELPVPLRYQLVVGLFVGTALRAFSYALELH